MVDLTEEEFYSKVRSEAQNFRHEKIKEIQDKGSATSEEIDFVETWARLFKENI